MPRPDAARGTWPGKSEEFPAVSLPNGSGPGHGGPAPLQNPAAAMNDQTKRIVSIGEVMIEMTRGPDGRFSQACGGDTFNTAVYLARRGLPVTYATALGDDIYSDRIVSLASAEGIATDLIVRVPGRLPGLYLIETDAKGERSFSYWRENAPARVLFELPDWGRVAESIVGARIVYFSGITLSIYSNQGLGRFLALLELARKAGTRSCSMAITVRAPGKATCSGPARCSWKR